jgi:hypothetical protein
VGDAAWLETIGTEAVVAGRGSAGRPGAVVFRWGCGSFVGIVWAHVDAEFSTALLKQKRNCMPRMHSLLRLESFKAASIRRDGNEFVPKIL